MTAAAARVDPVPARPAPCTLEARGAAFDRGSAQGIAFAAQIQACVHEVRRAAGWLAGREMRSAVRREMAQQMRWHLTHQHERMEGIAAGARVSLGDLALLEATWRVGGVGSLAGGQLEARLDLPPSLLAAAILRSTAPDSVGFHSVELSSAPLSGCLAGVNEKGIAVAVLDDRGPVEVPARALAQDVLYHAASLDAAIAHLRLRARYAGGTGELIVADADGRGMRAELRSGETSIVALLPTPSPPRETTVRVDAAARQVVFTAPDGAERVLALGTQRSATPHLG
jgi:hypothetical protein